MITSLLFTLSLGVVSLIFRPTFATYEEQLNRRNSVGWDLVRRSKVEFKMGNRQYGQQLLNLSKGHFSKAKKMKRNRRIFAVASVGVMCGLVVGLYQWDLFI